MCDCGALRFDDCVCPDKYPDEHCGTAHGGRLCTACDSSFPCKCGYNSTQAAIDHHQKTCIATVQMVANTALKKLKPETPAKVHDFVQKAIEGLSEWPYDTVVQSFPEFMDIAPWVHKMVTTALQIEGTKKSAETANAE